MARSDRSEKSGDVPPRPLCGCGKDATHAVSVSVRRLEVDQRSWQASYRNAHTNIETVVCDDCVRSKVNVTLAVSATVEKAKDALY